MSKIIKYFLAAHYLPTMLLFIGLIIGGLPSLTNKISDRINKSNILILLMVFLTITSLSLFNSDNNINFNTIL